MSEKKKYTVATLATVVEEQVASDKRLGIAVWALTAGFAFLAVMLILITRG